MLKFIVICIVFTIIQSVQSKVHVKKVSDHYYAQKQEPIKQETISYLSQSGTTNLNKPQSYNHQQQFDKHLIDYYYTKPRYIYYYTYPKVGYIPTQRYILLDTNNRYIYDDIEHPYYYYYRHRDPGLDYAKFFARYTALGGKAIDAPKVYAAATAHLKR